MSSEFDPKLLSKLHHRRQQRQLEKDEQKRKERERKKWKDYIALNGQQTSVTRVVSTKPVSKGINNDDRR